MTGFSSNYGRCIECSNPLKLGDTPRWIAYPSILAFTVVAVLCTMYLRDAIPYFAIVLPLSALVLAFPLGFLLAYFIRGVGTTIESKSKAG